MKPNGCWVHVRLRMSVIFPIWSCTSYDCEPSSSLLMPIIVCSFGSLFMLRIVTIWDHYQCLRAFGFATYGYVIMCTSMTMIRKQTSSPNWHR